MIWIKFDDSFTIEFRPSKTQEDLFSKLVLQYYPEIEICPILGARLTLSNFSDLQQLKSFLHAINNIKEQVPKIVILELEKLFFHAHILWLPPLYEAAICEKLKQAKNIDCITTFEESHYITVLEGPDYISPLEVPQKILNKYHTLFYFFKKYNEDKLFLDEKHNISKKEIKNEKSEKIDFIYETSDEKLRLELKKERDQEQAKRTAVFCAYGRDPNILIESDGKKDLLLTVAIYANRLSVVKVLLSYGADPQIRYGIAHQSPLEVILRRSEFELTQKISYEMHDVINWVINKPRFPIDKAITMKSVHTKITNKIFKTTFELSNSQLIYSYLVEINFTLPNDSSQLSGIWKILYDLFCKRYKSYDEFKINFGLNKYVDLIYAGDRLIGFIFFEIAYPRNDCFIQYGRYSYLDEEYQGTKIASLLIYRPGFCLQQMHPKKTGGILFLAVSYDSFRTAEKFKPYPKFLTDESEKFVEKCVLPCLEPDEKLYKNDGISRVINDNSYLGSINFDTKDPNEILFNEHILGFENEKKNNVTVTKSAPIFFFTKRNNLEKITKNFEERKIDFKNHIRELKIFLNKKTPEKPFLSLRSKL